MSQVRFYVMVGAHHHDTVYFDETMSALEVRKALINHDGYPSNISVYKLAPNQFRYTDCARATHPEELR